MIYFDNAATTLQKPSSVGKAVLHTMISEANSGRGDYAASGKAAETVFASREAAALLFSVPEPEQVIMTFNATHGLNIAIKSLVHPGSSVVISGYEHNAVTRTLAALEDVRLRVVSAPLFQQDMFLERMRLELRERPDVVICTHVSNVFGFVLPVNEVAALCRDQGIPLIVDVSQSAGVLPVSMETLQAAFIAMPGHKSLYGPQGTGLLLCGRDQHGTPLLQGGTGSLSLRQEMPDFLPDRLEAGTQNTPGIAGLYQGIRFVQEKGIDIIRQHEQELVQAAGEGLQKMDGVRVFQSDDRHAQTGVLSFVVDGRDCAEVGAYLSQNQVSVRTGLQCAPLAHRTAGTERTGTVRISFSAFNTLREVEAFLKIMRRMPE